MNALVPGSVAIVTGAAGGIGLAIVDELARLGVNVVCWDRPGVDFSSPLQVCRDRGVEAAAIEVDVTDRDAVMAAGRASQELGAVRYGVNCAGIDNLQPSATMPTIDWQRVLDVNLNGVLYSCLAQREAMLAGGGAIVNIASISGLIVNRDADPHIGYSSSKAAVIHLSRCLAVEWAAEGIRVNAVSPGYTRTEMTAHNPPQLNQAFVNQAPMGRMAEVHEIAGPVGFLLSDSASFVTGVNLPVDGGVTLW